MCLYDVGYSSPPSGDTDMIEAEAKHCNEKKDNAKGAGDISIEMFFVSFLRVRIYIRV